MLQLSGPTKLCFASAQLWPAADLIGGAMWYKHFWYLDVLLVVSHVDFF